MEAWESFAVAQVGAAAVLAGLIFVGVSVNLERVLALPGVPGRAGEALVILLALLISASLLLVPGLALTTYAVALILLGLAAGGTVLAIALASNDPRRAAHRGWFALRLALGALATLPLIIGGLATLRDGEAGLWWLAVAAIGTFLATFVDAWVLLIEIKR